MADFVAFGPARAAIASQIGLRAPFYLCKKPLVAARSQNDYGVGAGSAVAGDSTMTVRVVVAVLPALSIAM